MRIMVLGFMDRTSYSGCFSEGSLLPRSPPCPISPDFIVPPTAGGHVRDNFDKMARGSSNFVGHAGGVSHAVPPTWGETAARLPLVGPIYNRPSRLGKKADCKSAPRPLSR